MASKKVKITISGCATPSSTVMTVIHENEVLVDTVNEVEMEALYVQVESELTDHVGGRPKTRE